MGVSLYIYIYESTDAASYFTPSEGIVRLENDTEERLASRDRATIS